MNIILRFVFTLIINAAIPVLIYTLLGLVPTIAYLGLCLGSHQFIINMFLSGLKEVLAKPPAIWEPK